MSVNEVFYRSPHNYDLSEASDAAAHATVGPSLTVQSMSEDADINVIMHRFGITGKMPENVRVPMYADFSGISDYRSALHAVMAAEDAFMEIPAVVRAKFENDPQRFLEFCSQEANRDEMRALGLLKPVAPVVVPQKVEIVNLVPAVGSVVPPKTP